MPLHEPTNKALTGPSRILCVGFDPSQFREFAKIVKTRTGLDCEPKGLDVLMSSHGPSDHIIVTHCGSSQRSASRRASPHIPDAGPSDTLKFAVVAADADRRHKSDVFRKGYVDYLTYPFISAEIARRLNSSVLHASAVISQPKFSSDPLVDQCCHFLSSDLTFSMRVEALARLMGTNRNKLSKRFRAALNDSPIGWLRKARLTQAALLLTETDQSILEVGFAVGYEDANNFSTAFRRTFGMAPRAYRHQCRNQRS